ncbi:MAG: hypothetical protein ACRDTE_25665 [Pseudonocardiaceae bacterium]
MENVFQATGESPTSGGTTNGARLCDVLDDLARMPGLDCAVYHRAPWVH